MPTQDTGGTRFGFVEGYDGEGRKPEESSQAGLASASAPCLRDHARRHSEFGTGAMCFVEQGLEAGITALDGDQRAGVERDAGHSGQPERLAGPRAVHVSGRPGFGGHLRQQHAELLVAAALLDRLGHEGRDGCRAAIGTASRAATTSASGRLMAIFMVIPRAYRPSCCEPSPVRTPPAGGERNQS